MSLNQSTFTHFRIPNAQMHHDLSLKCLLKSAFQMKNGVIKVDINDKYSVEQTKPDYG